MTRTLHYHLAFLDKDFVGWSDFVATNFLLDTALTTFFEAAQNSSYEPLGQRARKVVQEERIHQVHAEGWVRRLARAGGAVREALTNSINRLWNETLCWIGPHDDPTVQQLYRGGMHLIPRVATLSILSRRNLASRSFMAMKLRL